MVNVNNGRRKRFCRVNSSMRIKKVMWLCAMGWRNLTNQQTDLIPQHLKRCYSHFKMPEQSLSSKYFCIIVLHDCFPKQQHPPLKAMTAFTVFHMLALSAQVMIYANYYIQWLLLLFLVIFSATVYQEVTILFSLTRWMEMVLIRKCFYVIFQFCA